LIEAFENGLRNLGWVAGQNMILEYRYAEGKAERFPALAAELVHLPVDVIVAPPAPARLAAKRGNYHLPIVFTLGADPFAFGV
jgi:putative ABC transport system substrate-binding protein